MEREVRFGGLKGRPSYEALVRFMETDPVKIHMPNRAAEQMRWSFPMTQFDNYGHEQQREVARHAEYRQGDDRAPPAPPNLRPGDPNVFRGWNPGGGPDMMDDDEYGGGPPGHHMPGFGPQAFHMPNFAPPDDIMDHLIQHIGHGAPPPPPAAAAPPNYLANALAAAGVPPPSAPPGPVGQPQSFGMNLFNTAVHSAQQAMHEAATAIPAAAIGAASGVFQGAAATAGAEFAIFKL